MKIELHLIQNFAPSCLNRDDTNSPKDCVFGGVRRARISSQCIKRAIRNQFQGSQLLPQENLAKRTKRLADEVADKLAEQDRDRDTAHVAAQVALQGLFGIDADTGQTQYLLFVGQQGIDALVNLCNEHWDALAETAEKIKKAQEDGNDKKAAKDIKKAAKDAVPKEIKDALSDVLDGSKAADLALFGRMLADLPKENIDAACQVAHAISVNKVDMDMDFFTAVDDLKTTEEDAGAGMMGTIGFNSSCFYRYAVIDTNQLADNLGGDRELAEKTIEAFLRASVSAIPSGKQNTFAAHNPPDFILADIRKASGPVSLANAFVKPARPDSNHNGNDLTQAAVGDLKDYWDKLAKVYAADGDLVGPFCCGTVDVDTSDGWQDAGSFDELVNKVMAAVKEA
jgi:CRISPR system Cascade subunit CasC